MDDSCAVCADALEWVAYGFCGHREVCSTCVVRMRFVLDDRKCCICKTENPFVFVTKAMGDYTRIVTDFSVFPSSATEGKAGEFWYHEATQTYFDDIDHYRMIKAMCRLSCSVCDKHAEEQVAEGTRRRNRFRDIMQLKGHLRHQHGLFMCNLCLEGRKVFICEQKLYKRYQLDQHISTGDSEVDGDETERGGFMGHPMCEFCRRHFYADNELYMHMSTEHFTCHICQRRHPGQYDYFKNYDDLESHFRQEHFLCENEACLAKKFIVFQSEAEMKRHNAIEHGGNMSRSQRIAALQIPTSFRFRRNEQEQRRGRGRGYRPDPPDNQLSMAIQASLETAVANSNTRDSSSGSHLGSGRGETSQSDVVSGSFESVNSSSEQRPTSLQSQSSRTAPILEELSFPPLADIEPPSETSSRYAQALRSSANSADLKKESFPPLPGLKNGGKNQAKLPSQGLAKNALGARVHIQQKGLSGSSSSSQVASTSSASQAWPAVNHGGQPSRSVSPQILCSSSSSSQVRYTPNNQGASTTSISQAWPAITHRGSSLSSAPPQVKVSKEDWSVSQISSSSAWNTNNASKMKHSASAPNLVEGDSWSQHTSTKGSSTRSSQSPSRVDDVHSANKSLVETIRASLGDDEDKYAAFKSISAEYRQNVINTSEYLSYVQQFGLVHLVPELARLCPDAQKQKELIEGYNNTSLQVKGPLENDRSYPGRSKGVSLSNKGKGKINETAVNTSAKEALADNILSTVKKLQSERRSPEDEVEVLSKDGYRAAKGKQPVSGASSISAQLTDSSGEDEQAHKNPTSSSHKSDGEVVRKQRKKTSKFHRIRLGDSSSAAFFDSGQRDASPEHAEAESRNNPGEGLPVRGAWRSGGGQRLFGPPQKGPAK